MSNNWYQQQPDGYQPAGNNDVARSGSLLSGYQPQQPPMNTPQAYNQYSPISPTNMPPPQPERWPGEQAGIMSKPRSKGQGLLSNAVQMARSWSGKMASVQGISTQSAPPPLVLYHPGLNQTQAPKSKPWKRSRTLRITRQMRQRRQ